MIHLSIGLAGSTLLANFEDLTAWQPILNSAESIGLVNPDRVGVNGADGEYIKVDLTGPRRWIAFRRHMDGSWHHCIGYQETVGAIQRAGMIIGGSNRKTLVWLHPSGRVYVGDSP